MLFSLVLFPVLIAFLGLAFPWNRWRPLLLPVLGTGHLVLTVLILAVPGWNLNYDWVILDPLGKLIILCISVLFFFCSVYAVGYLRYWEERANRVFVACFSGLLGLLSLVVMSHHLGLMWVAIEGSTLISAPLIYFNHNKLSIEATWKYLLVGSVGIALALLGTFFLAYAALAGGMPATLSFDELIRGAPGLSKTWLRAAFILLLVGYGTKLGLAPMHSWKPDAYGESPGVVGALFAGGITSAAFLALIRVYQICQAAGETAFASLLLLILGGLSMAVAGMFLIGQKDLKRMLAYSSVEHMGILALGLGVGKAAFFGTLLHVVNNTLTKGVLFLSTANIQRAFDSKSVDVVRGAFRRLPLSGALLLAGFLAITGSPPFAPFVSEFSILKGALDSGLFFIAGLFLILLLLVFVGMGNTVLKAVQGRFPQHLGDTDYHDGFLSGAPIVGLMLLVLLLGIVIPPPLRELVDEAVRSLEGQS
jgi:hydrogenase-4 component F